MTPRERIIAALTTMPDEAFSWFAFASREHAQLSGSRSPGAFGQIWPDGIGGFSGASRAAITELRKAVDDYVDESWANR